MPTFGSLFAGIGGIDLGLERAGWDCRFQVEWDPFCQRVLAKHWPDVPRYGDIHDVHGVAPRDPTGGCPNCLPTVDLLAGGFPCQPFSQAGKRQGKADERWLWPEFARLIRELRPRYVLVENVPGLLAGHGGMGSVLGDLATLGYDAEWESIPASAVGAPHLRYRVWIVAHANGGGREVVGFAGSTGVERARGYEPDGRGEVRERQYPAAMAHSDSQGPQGHRGLGGEWNGAREWFAWPSGWPKHGWWRVEPDVRGVVDGLSEGLDGGWWDGEWPGVPRVAHGVPDRVNRLRSLGNAVVPQVVEFIGRRILEAEAREVA